MAIIDAVTADITTKFSEFSGSVNNLSYLKVANTIEQFNIKSRYSSEPDFWIQTSNINGSVSHDPDRTARILTIGSGATDEISSQTKQAFVYLSGNVHRFTCGVSARDLEIGARLDFGIFDVENGPFFRIERDDNSTLHLSCGRRSKASGVVVDYIITHANFNIDKMDGRGPSKKVLDLEKIQMFHIEFSWYGAGGVSYGLEIDRKIHYIHWEGAGNHLTEPIFGQPDLPVRYVLKNTKATSGPSSVEIGGIFVGVDGSFEERKGKSRTLVVPNINVTSGTTRVLATLRPKTFFNGQINRGYIKLDDLFVFGTADGYYYLALDPTPSNTPTWQDVNTSKSIMEYSTNYTTAGLSGTAIYAGAISSQRESDTKATLQTKEPITAYSDGSRSTEVALIFVCQANGTINFGINWSEYY